MKFFNTVGPINPEKHYYIPGRLNEQEIKTLIEQEKYYILHAPRQSGKTTVIKALAQQLNNEGTYKALYVNIESAQAARSDFIEGLLIILRQMQEAIEDTFGLQEEGLGFFKKELNRITISGYALGSFLRFWSQHSEKKIILFFDEIDSLVGDTLISVLRQLRTGYADRPESFPQSVCLVGVRDVRDYIIWSDKQNEMVLGGSAFNIKAKSLVLADFTPEQVRNLYLQHTQETGQQFTDEALSYVFYLTQGQPWLTNALAYQACFEDVVDRTETITKEVIERAKETLIFRQDTHLDVLMSRLKEDRVYRVIDEIISGASINPRFTDEDVKYVADLGLVKQNSQNIWISNPIYQEILPRALASTMQKRFGGQSVDYVNLDGSLNMKKFLEKFTQFYRENSEIWMVGEIYQESAPHIIMMAFLQRVINGGGTIHREYALGRKRVDLLVVWQAGKQRIVIELKVWRSKNTLEEGLTQTSEYMDKSNATEGHLVIFDRRLEKTWDEKVYHRQETVDHKIIDVWGI